MIAPTPVGAAFLRFGFTFTDGLMSQAQKSRRYKTIAKLWEGDSSQPELEEIWTHLIAELFDSLPDDDPWWRPDQRVFDGRDVLAAGSIGIPALLDLYRTEGETAVRYSTQSLLRLAQFGVKAMLPEVHTLTNPLFALTEATRLVIGRRRLYVNDCGFYEMLRSSIDPAARRPKEYRTRHKIPNGFYDALLLPTHTLEPPF